MAANFLRGFADISGLAAPFSRLTVWLLRLHCGILVLAAIASDAAAGCKKNSNPPHLDNDLSFHVVAGSSNGKPLWPKITSNDSGFAVGLDKHPPTFEDEDKYKNVYLKGLIEHLNHTKREKILIFIHGGMNFPTKALHRSAILGKRILDESNYYPVFIIWNSQPIGTYGEHLFLVRQGQRQPVIGPVTSPFYLLSDLARACARAPEVWERLLEPQFSRMEHSRAVFAQESWRYLKDQKVIGAPDITRASLREQDKRGAAHKTVNALHDVLLPVKAPGSIILDAIGTGAWDMMLRRAHLLFESPTRFHYETKKNREAIKQVVRTADRLPKRQARTLEEQRDIDHQVASLLAQQGGDSNKKTNYLVRSTPGAVEMFLQALEEAESKRGRHYSITLVGHSMGAIVSNEILIRHPKLSFDKIVYMAAACSVKECEEAVVPYLRNRLRKCEGGQSSPAEFYNLSLHPAGDATEALMAPECEKPTVGQYAISSVGLLAPRGSLLEWLDGFFTHPVSFEDRRLGKWTTAVSSAGIFPKEIANHVHLTMFPIGQFGVPQKHGQFSSEEFQPPFWNKDFWNPNPTPAPTPHNVGALKRDDL